MQTLIWFDLIPLSFTNADFNLSMWIIFNKFLVTAYKLIPLANLFQKVSDLKMYLFQKPLSLQ